MKDKNFLAKVGEIVQNFILEIRKNDCVHFQYYHFWGFYCCSSSLNQSLEKKLGYLPVYFGHVWAHALSDMIDECQQQFPKIPFYGLTYLNGVFCCSGTWYYVLHTLFDISWQQKIHHITYTGHHTRHKHVMNAMG
jgi:hypothetical protein